MIAILSLYTIAIKLSVITISFISEFDIYFFIKIPLVPIICNSVPKLIAILLEYVKIAQVTNIAQTMKELKRKGFWIVGTDMDGTNYSDIDYKGKMALVIGNEGKGMSRIVKENCDFIASIPMIGKINSLNASVAAGIMIYEAVRLRK